MRTQYPAVVEDEVEFLILEGAVCRGRSKGERARLDAIAELQDVMEGGKAALQAITILWWHTLRRQKKQPRYTDSELASIVEGRIQGIDSYLQVAEEEVVWSSSGAFSNKLRDSLQRCVCSKTVGAALGG